MEIPWFDLTLIYKPEVGEARIALRSLKRSSAVCGAFLHDIWQSLGLFCLAWSSPKRLPCWSRLEKGCN